MYLNYKIKTQKVKINRSLIVIDADYCLIIKRACIRMKIKRSVILKLISRRYVDKDER